jgi:hypothetical protein
MPFDLESGILGVLRARTDNDRPITFNDFARQFGASAPVVASLGRQLVAKGLAQPSYVLVRGVETLYALLPVTAAAPEKVAAAAAPVAAAPPAAG